MVKGKKRQLKPLLPSLREKKRYLVYEVVLPKCAGCKEVSGSISDSALNFLGVLGTAKAGILHLNDKWNSALQRGVIRVGHRHLDNIRASLMLVDKVSGKDAAIRSVGASGTLKKAVSNYLNVAG